ncbi:hypothetical protein Riv7116_2516 [Rivularia sp. PCC 7116]|nr:hypothetical protein Riv7116_2516 [Rivularia sp. PCC 7116]
MGVQLANSQGIRVGDKVIILRPSHIAGKVGFIYAKEILSDEEVSKRWIVRIDSENIMVSLTPKEFELLSKS